MIWRRLLIRSDLTLFGLHRAIQIVFGWEDYHLHAFKVHGRQFGTQWTGQRHHLVEDGKVLRELTLADLSLRLRQRMMYEYDFGDFWEHEIRVETREQPSADKPWPVCIDGARAGPPEDIGGPDGYERLLERLEDVRIEQEDGLYGLLDEDELDDEGQGDGKDWTPADRAGFDGPDDPLLRYDSEAIDRRAINVALKAEFAGKDRSVSATAAQASSD